MISNKLGYLTKKKNLGGPYLLKLLKCLIGESMNSKFLREWPKPQDQNLNYKLSRFRINHNGLEVTTNLFLE